MNNLLECKICFLIYSDSRKPIILPCGHTFCSSCVWVLSPEDSFCPSCRNDISTPFDQLPIVYSLLDIANEYNKENNSTVFDNKDVKVTFNSDVKCKYHPEKFIKFCCKILEDWLCDDCLKIHSHPDPTQLNHCTVSVESALQLFKTYSQELQGEKLKQILIILEETDDVSSRIHDLEERLKLYSDGNNSLMVETDSIKEYISKFKNKALRCHVKLSEFHLKINEVDSIKDWFVIKDKLMKNDNMLEMKSEFLELKRLIDVVS